MKKAKVRFLKENRKGDIIEEIRILNIPKYCRVKSTISDYVINRNKKSFVKIFAIEVMEVFE